MVKTPKPKRSLSKFLDKVREALEALTAPAPGLVPVPQPVKVGPRAPVRRPRGGR